MLLADRVALITGGAKGMGKGWLSGSLMKAAWWQ